MTIKKDTNFSAIPGPGHFQNGELAEILKAHLIAESLKEKARESGENKAVVTFLIPIRLRKPLAKFTDNQITNMALSLDGIYTGSRLKRPSFWTPGEVTFAYVMSR